MLKHVLGGLFLFCVIQIGFVMAEEMQVDLGNGVKLELVYIPAGEFMMGSDKGENDEKSVHRVKITQGFYMGRYEVMQEQYEAVMGNNPSYFKGDRNPVERVSWNDAKKFCDKLSAKTGNAMRLPTEAEWEYAGRAGSSATYCFGDSETQLGDYGWYPSNSSGQTHSVGGKRPNAWGLYDMHGNVWEWCNDWYDEGYYSKSPLKDPEGPSSGSSRVVRGGSWVSDSYNLRSANRSYSYPNEHVPHHRLPRGSCCFRGVTFKATMKQRR